MRRLVTLHPDADNAAWRRTAVFLVMLAHTMVFLGVAVSILHIFYAGVRGRPSVWTRRALWLAVGECAVFVGYRFRCPLRTVAESLGAETGQVTDIFLPRWFADRIPWFFTPPLAVGLLGLLRHRRQSRPA
jgi:hypothetical protein